MDITVDIDLSFDRVIHFPIFLLKFSDQNDQNQGKLLEIVKHSTIYLFSSTHRIGYNRECKFYNKFSFSIAKNNVFDCRN